MSRPVAWKLYWMVIAMDVYTIKLKRIVLLFLPVGLLLGSCVKQGAIQCPGLQITVQDKNYDNIREIEGLLPLSEELPLLKYVNPLSMEWLRAGAASLETRIISVPSDEKTHAIPSTFFEKGNYDLAVSGNYGFENQTSPSTDFPIMLHPDGGEGADIYLQNDRFTIPLASDRTVALQRTKGKLLLQFVDFPAEITTVKTSVRGVYAQVNAYFQYSGSTTVTKPFFPGQPDTGNYYSLLLAPTDASGHSLVDLTLLDNTGNTTHISDIPVTISRNHLTVLRQRYLPDEQAWEISLWVNGTWEVIHNLAIGNPI